SGAADQKLDVGPFESETLVLTELDSRGRRRRAEVFGPDHLDAAVLRLYQRYAALLPDGPSRERAAATARAVAGSKKLFVGGDKAGASYAREVESIDHRVLGTWSAQGVQVVLQNVRALVDLTSDLHARYDDVLALCPNAYLSRLRVCGSLREGGGAFERPYLGLWVFGADGLIVRWEQFDVGREAEALARFDELAGEVAEPAAIAS